MAESGIVYVVDDDPSLCELIENALTRAGLKVRSFPSAEAFANFDLCVENGDGPCCVLLDVVMPGMSGLEFLEQRYAGDFPCPIIIITGRGSIRTAVKSMQLGAIDFLEKPFTTEALTELVLRTLKAHPCDCKGVQERHAIRARIAKLSPRERQLLEGIVQGHSTKVIADQLGISARTIDHHRANMMEKMRAGNVADLVRMAVQANYRNVALPGLAKTTSKATPTDPDA
jgi:two-component system, LuxR family, response regulator FixJ